MIALTRMREGIMQRLFTVQKGNRVPDGTVVYPFLNCQDSTSNLPRDLLEDFSLAFGEIAPQQQSKIHVMPLVTHVTLVLQGQLVVRMRDRDQPWPYSLLLTAEQAVLTRRGTFLQLSNSTSEPCRVLYIVSPAYLFLMDEEGRVVYDDSIVLNEDWAELERVNWKPERLCPLELTLEARHKAAGRLKG